MKNLKKRAWHVAVFTTALLALANQLRLQSSPTSLLSPVFAAGRPDGAQNDIVIEDIFGRTVNGNEIALVDWEGYLANPAIKLFVKPPVNAAFPATATLTANHQRLYFDLPSEFGASGPRKTIALANASARAQFLLSIFPDRDTADEDHTLNIELIEANGARRTLTIKIHVIDQDEEQSSPFKITVDFSQDGAGFFADPQKRALIQQAADDWAYFIGDMNLNPVPAGAEQTFIWNPDGFISGSFTTNSYAYTGFLLYAYGIHHEQLRSGGEGSRQGGFQASGNMQLPLRRSGGLEIETMGNYNTLGWFVSTADHDWWRTGNLRNEQNDLFSIAHHEIGHALFFNPAYPLFAEARSRGFINDPRVVEYHGSNPVIAAGDHFMGSIDRASERGVFGYEYFGNMPRRRWIITKLDLLNAQAIGYRLRQTSALAPLIITSSAVAASAINEPFNFRLRAAGGVPFYHWTVASGSLPPGLSLDPFTGVISGTPGSAGIFSFTVNVRDYSGSGAGVSQPMIINIMATPTAANVSAASYDDAMLAPEAIVAAFGVRLATRTEVASALPLPTNLAGTTVKVRDSVGTERLAALFFVAPTQVNYQLPPGTASGLATVTITSGDGSVSMGAAQIAVVAPGLFTADASGKGLPAASVLRVKADGSQISEPVVRFDPVTNKFMPVPIDLGPLTDQVFLVLFGTGLRFGSSLSAVTLEVGDVKADVLYAGAQGMLVGLDQVNALLPRSLIGREEVEAVLSVDSQMANRVKIHIK